MAGSFSGNGVVQAGKEVTLKAIPEDGYAFKEWRKGETVVSESRVYSFEADASLKEITGVFEAKRSGE